MSSRSRETVLLVIGVLALAGSAGAVPAPREEPANTTPPVRVFVGETLNISAVALTGGGTIGTDRVTLVGQSGAADGELYEISDPTAADFTHVTPGAYYVHGDSDEDVEFVVREPRVTSVTIRNQHGANVTNGWEPTGEALTITAQYNFDAADRLDVTVRAPSGIDITKEVATTSRITTSGGSIQVDLSTEPAGTYRITVRGSALASASQTVTVRTGSRETATTTRTPTTSRTTVAPQTSTTTTHPPTTTTLSGPTATSVTSTTTAAPSISPSPAPTTTTATSTPGFSLGLALVAAFAAFGLLLRRH